MVIKMMVLQSLPAPGKSLHTRFVLLSVLFLFLAGKAYTQNACPIGSATPFTVCPAENQILGTTLTEGASYTWYKDGLRVAGPLPGDGGSTSFGFEVNSAPDAGHYYIEVTQAGITTCVPGQNMNITLVSLPASQTLTGGGPLCNSQKILSLTGSEINVTYELLLNDGPTGITINSNSTGPKNFPPVFWPGTYSIRAYNNSCYGVYSFFGNTLITGEPAIPVINYTTTTTANVSWSGSGNFIAEYGLKGFTPGTGGTAGAGGTLINASSSPVNITTGLAAGTSYDIWIRQFCGAGAYTSNQVANFITDCAPITSFPYIQGFETATPPDLPGCWKTYDNNNDGLTWITATNYPRTGANNVELTADINTTSRDNYLLLPPMILTGNQRLKYWVATAGAFSPQLYQVRLSTTNNSPAAFSNVLLTETAGSQAGYEEKIINLTGYSGLVYIAIYVPPDAPMANYLMLDDFTVENIPPCPGPSFVKVNSTTSSSANVSWSGSGSFIAEYGAAGFNPGTGATGGAGGTVIANATSPLTIPGLAAGTSYDVYIRQNCSGSGNGFSGNSPKINFTTFFTCTPVILTTCTDKMASVAAGNGVIDFDGLYPNNSVGFLSTPGKELLYSFTPTSTGVYYLDMTASSAGGLSYLYKVAAAGCGNTGWTGISYISTVGKYPVGLLQSGTEYYFLLDNPSTTTAKTQTFKICLATVASPSATDVCIPANFPGSFPPNIPAYSPKPEYIIDAAGNLIARLDFSNVSNAVGTVNFSYYVNSGAIRRDNVNKEYLDRNFSFTTTNVPVNPVGVTLYFTNAEFQHLVNEPDDGIADVNSVADLKVTRDQVLCGPDLSGGITSYISQTGSGVYDANAKYIQFNSPGLSTFYLHGGVDALFNNSVLCPGSSTDLVMNPVGTGYLYQWQVNTGTGFVNIVNNEYYTGVNNPTLTIRYPPTSYYGYKYRCIASNSTGNIISDSKTLRFSMEWEGSKNTIWENPENWSCNGSSSNNKLPDANTDVIIPSATVKPVINSNVSCRSLLVQPGATLQVNPGFKLTITGH